MTVFGMNPLVMAALDGDGVVVASETGWYIDVPRVIMPRTCTLVLRIRYPDGSYWFAVQLPGSRGGLIAHSRSHFAPEFGAPD